MGIDAPGNKRVAKQLCQDRKTALRTPVTAFDTAQCSDRNTVCDTVLLNRSRIGHTRLTHSYLLSGDDLPECGTCQCPLTVGTDKY